MARYYADIDVQIRVFFDSDETDPKALREEADDAYREIAPTFHEENVEDHGREILKVEAVPEKANAEG